MESKGVLESSHESLLWEGKPAAEAQEFDFILDIVRREAAFRIWDPNLWTDDLVSEAYIKVGKHVSWVVNCDYPDACVVKIVRNLLYDLWQKEKQWNRFSQVALDDIDVPSNEPSVELRSELRELAVDYPVKHGALSEAVLRDAQRYYFLGETARAIAADNHCCPNAVYLRCWRYRKAVERAESK